MSVNSRVHVVVPAAGLGLRMGASLPKQYLPLIDRPILQWTLETLTSLNPANLVVAINAED
ncbi:MAG: 2-C-methyl-D-erythritol 4-phosphate cytidylyltransferase, partial [Pseudomonadales bacterium]